MPPVPIPQTSFLTVLEKRFEPVYISETIANVYPLIELGIDRAGAQRIIAAGDVFGTVFPSQCIRCHWKAGDPGAIAWTAKLFPDQFREWQELEATKKRDKPGTGANHGVGGVLSLAELRVQGDKTISSLDDAGIERYRMTHGHCIGGRAKKAS